MHIFHLQPNTEKTYRFVGFINETLQDFYLKSQNFDDNIEYLALEVRSTSVGDIIFYNDVFYIINDIGIAEVDFIFSMENSSII